MSAIRDLYKKVCGESVWVSTGEEFGFYIAILSPKYIAWLEDRAEGKGSPRPQTHNRPSAKREYTHRTLAGTQYASLKAALRPLRKR